MAKTQTAVAQTTRSPATTSSASFRALQERRAGQVDDKKQHV